MSDEQAPATDEDQAFRYTHSAGFAESLAAFGATLWVSTYQAGKLAVFRAQGQRLSMLPRTFDKAMGIAVSAERLALATRQQIWLLPNERILAPRIKPAGQHDACYVPRSSHVTGNIDAHEIAWGGGPTAEVRGQRAEDRAERAELWIVNTMFSCLCTIDPQYSFVPRWRPPFVSQLIREDRCHLNGLAMVDGEPKYVTAFAETDKAEGWRDHKRSGGVLIDVPSGQIVARGLSMPHSPRVHNGRLWLLDSGNGRLVTVDPQDGQVEVVAELPGYTRGLAFRGQYAFIGLSRIRETAVFGGVAIEEQLEHRKCGVWVVDLESGQTVGNVEFEKTVDEIFDVQVLLGVRFPAVLGFEKKTIERACVIGPETPIGQPVGDAELWAGRETRPQRPLVLGAGLPTPPNLQSAAPEDPRITETMDAKAHNNLGLRLYREGKREQAAECFRRAVHLQADYAKAHSNLGNVLAELDRTDEALRHCRCAVALEPDYATAHNNLGSVLLKLEKTDSAADCFQTAVDLRPDYVLALCNLGRALQAAKRTEEAERAWREALLLEPARVDALCGLGNALLGLDRPDDAAAAFDAAINVDPEFVSAWNDRGLALMRLGRIDEAISHYNKALELCPDSEGVHRNLAYARFTQGDFASAWPHYEWRWKDKSPSDPPLTQPRWDGSPLAGRTIVLHSEQGLGDTIQFVRFAARVRDNDARVDGSGGPPTASGASAGQSQRGNVVLACQPALVPLLSTCPGIDRVLPKDGPVPECDVHAPLMSVPAILGTTVEAIPAEVPYLRARADLQKQWSEELDKIAGFKIGIAWQGNPEYADDRSRSIPLLHFAALAAVKGVTLISLQKGFGSEQLAGIDFPVVDWGPRLDERTGAFEDSAALITQLDLVVSSDTAIVHLAGALGAPVWVALSRVPDWRFMLGRDDSPWYPTMRLFRQPERGDWDDVFQRIGQALHELRSKGGTQVRE